MVDDWRHFWMQVFILRLCCHNCKMHFSIVSSHPKVRNIFLSFCMVFGSSQRIDNIIFRLRSKIANEWKTNSKCYAYRSKFLYMDMDMDTLPSHFLGERALIAIRMICTVYYCFRCGSSRSSFEVSTYLYEIGEGQPHTTIHTQHTCTYIDIHTNPIHFSVLLL